VLACALALAPALAAQAMAPRPAVLPADAPPLPAWLTTGDGTATPGPDELVLRWLGTAGFELRSARGAILIDPYYSRTPLLGLLAGPARPDEAAIRARLRPGVAGVFVGHGHFDHLLDAPAAAKLAGATLFASDSALGIAAQEGLPEAQRFPLRAGMIARIADFEVEAVESRHSSMPTQFLAGGELPEGHAFPLRFLEYKNGPVYGFLIRWRGRAIYHCGSADLVDASLAGKRADVALVCVSGWKSDPGFFGRIARALRPSVIAPMHHDDFFKPYEAGFVENPLAYHAEALAAIRHDAPGAAILGLGFFDDHRLRARDAR
jgi:L-ascorbate metabolism protein UlaG (beta-lactamase superfamily)